MSKDDLGISLSTGGVVAAVALLVGSILLTVLLRRLLVRALDRGDADRNVGRLTGRFLSVVLISLGLVLALNELGVRVGPLVGALGVGGVALAFALQDVLKNFVAGVLLQVRRPFRTGDQIRSGEFEGRVDDVNLRTVELTTYDGLTVYLPNSKVLQEPIVNYTRTPHSRTSLTVGVAYDTDLVRAREVLLVACTDTEGLEGPPAEVWVEEFADSSVNLAVRFWHPADIASRWRVRSDVALSIKAALDQEGITIPFPQRTLWFGPGGTTLPVALPGSDD